MQAHVTRVVLLGDSFVFGYKTDQEDRLGVFLRRYLRERASDTAAEVECLHVAISSWNVQAECAYVRRQLGALRPEELPTRAKELQAPVELVAEPTAGNHLLAAEIEFFDRFYAAQRGER